MFGRSMEELRSLRVPKYDFDKIEQLYRETGSLIEVAEKLNVEYKLLSNWLNRAKNKPRWLALKREKQDTWRRARQNRYRRGLDPRALGR